MLRAQPAQAEHRLVGSALIDLCQGIDDDEIAGLPGVQAAALSIALLRRAPDAPPTPHIVAFAFTTLLRALAAAQPVLVCIDDLQWLDAQTADVLAFAARRLPESGVGLLATLRTDPDVPPPPLVADLAAALPLTRTTVAPLARPARRLLRADSAGTSRAGRCAPPPAARAAIRSSPSRSPARRGRRTGAASRTSRCRCRNRCSSSSAGTSPRCRSPPAPRSPRRRRCVGPRWPSCAPSAAPSTSTRPAGPG